jgi:hypothetical protein
MGIAVIGGMAFATVLTLYVIPAIFLRKQRFQRNKPLSSISFIYESILPYILHFISRLSMRGYAGLWPRHSNWTRNNFDVQIGKLDVEIAKNNNGEQAGLLPTLQGTT